MRSPSAPLRAGDLHSGGDGFINPFQTARFCRNWAALAGGCDTVRRRARLFMVPGMYHGNKGPNAFDALGVLERWVEQGTPPEEMIATTYTNDDRRQPGLRTMPMCAFPKQVRSSGSGDVNSAANRSSPFSEDLLQAGPSGALAGLEGLER